MDYFVQRQNALHNSDHTDYVDAPGNYRDETGEYEVNKCDINNYLGTALEDNYREFVHGNISYDYSENDAIEWSCDHKFSIL